MDQQEAILVEKLQHIKFLGLAIIGLPYFEIPMLLLENARSVNLLQEGLRNLLFLYNLFQWKDPFNNGVLI